MRALIPIVGSNEQQLEQLITHELFGKVNPKEDQFDFKNCSDIDENLLVVHRWFFASASLVITQSYRQICTTNTNDVQYSPTDHQSHPEAFSECQKFRNANEIVRGSDR